MSANPTAEQTVEPTAVNAPTTNRQPTFPDIFGLICDNIGSVIRGKDSVVELAVLCLVAEGHLLIEDVPGVGKTSLAKALARTVGGTFGRVQFTPDLLPADVLGTSVWNQQQGVFEFRPGPVFNNIVLADEVNRSSPKTQSALLEAMAESQVTTDGVTRSLSRPFMVIATQNPLEYHGTYPLPESQLDRFLLKLSVGYPSRADEGLILGSEGAHPGLATLRPVVGVDHIRAMSAHCRRVHISPTLTSYLLDVATATRTHRSLSLGMSPRATLGLQRAVQVRAAAQGRDHGTPDDVKALAVPTLAHRLVVTPEAQIQGVGPAEVLIEILDSVAVPRDAR